MILPVVPLNETVVINEDPYTIWQRIESNTRLLDSEQQPTPYNLYAEMVDTDPLIVVFQLHNGMFSSSQLPPSLGGTTLTATITKQSNFSVIRMRIITNPWYLAVYAFLSIAVLISLLKQEGYQVLLFLLVMVAFDIVAKWRLRRNVRILLLRE